MADRHGHGRPRLRFQFFICLAVTQLIVLSLTSDRIHIQFASPARTERVPNPSGELWRRIRRMENKGCGGSAQYQMWKHGK